MPPISLDALYLHVPFCFHKCHYCDFYSIVDPPAGKADRQQRFTDALIAELTHQANAYQLHPRTIFVGGGTPTMLRPELWRQLLDAMRQLGIFQNLVEFTVEANPETVTSELVATLVAGGVNRVSMGAQSFQPPLLKALERWHDPASVGRAVHMLREGGIDNINLDLIFAIPGQTTACLDADLKAALALNPTHLSYYSLIFEPHTPLTKKMQLGLVKPVDEEVERDMYEHVINRLYDAGFEHYEVSNWARSLPTKPNTCLHNILYWSNANWLGVGPSASSHVNGRRWKNQPHLGKYLANAPQPPIVDEEQLPHEQRVGEQIMLSLRLRKGVPLQWLDNALAPQDPRRTLIDEYIGHGLLERTTTHLRLTHQGLFLADTLIGNLL